MPVLGALLLALSQTDANCAAPPGILAPTAQVSYASHFDGTLWNGQKMTFNAAVKVTSNPRSVLVAYDKTAPKPLDAPVDGCGIVATDSQAIAPINAALALAIGAPAHPSAGHSWHGTVQVQVAPNQTTDVPIDVTFTQETDGAILLQGSGRAIGTINAYGVPFDLNYQSAALFSNGRLVKATSAAQEAISAGPQSQTLKLAWDVRRQE